MNNVFNIIPISYQITENFGNISYEERINHICELIKPYKQNIVLNLIGEDFFSLNLATSILNKISIDPKEITLIFGVDTNGRFKNYKCEVNYFGFCNWFNFYKKLQNSSVDWKNIKLEKYFLALSHRPTPLRASYIKHILDYHKDQSLVSFGFDSKINNMIKNILYPYQLPITIDVLKIEKSENLNISYLHNAPSNTIFKCLFNIVLETNEPNNPSVFITEKTFKSFAWHQIPIFVVNYKQIEKLREAGFDLFDDILEDHKYALYPGSQQIKIFSLLKKLLLKYPSLTDLNNLRNKVWSRLEKNNNILKSMVEKDTYDWSRF